MKFNDILLAAGIHLTAVQIVTAADCGGPWGSYQTTYVPTGTAWNAWQWGISEMERYGSTAKVSLTVADGQHENIVQLQKDATGSTTSTLHARSAYNNIWSQCMDNGYNCAASYNTGTWSYQGQWYWGWWNRDASWGRTIRHCGLKRRAGRRGEGSDSDAMVTRNVTVPTVLSITTTNVTRDELPYPEMFAGDPEDELYPMITVVLDLEGLEGLEDSE